MREEKSFSQRAFSICTDIRKLQDKAKTSLTEDRPYKKGLSHEKTCEMLDDMVQKGFVDSDISKKIRECFGGI